MRLTADLRPRTLDQELWTGADECRVADLPAKGETLRILVGEVLDEVKCQYRAFRAHDHRAGQHRLEHGSSSDRSNRLGDLIPPLARRWSGLDDMIGELREHGTSRGFEFGQGPKELIGTQSRRYRDDEPATAVLLDHCRLRYMHTRGGEAIPFGLTGTVISKRKADQGSHGRRPTGSSTGRVCLHESIAAR